LFRNHVVALKTFVAVPIDDDLKIRKKN